MSAAPQHLLLRRRVRRVWTLRLPVLIIRTIIAFPYRGWQSYKPVAIHRLGGHHRGLCRLPISLLVLSCLFLSRLLLLLLLLDLNFCFFFL